MKTTFALAVLCSLATPVLAKGNADPKVAKLPKEVQPMYALVGDWAGQGQLTLGGKPHKMELKISCSPSAGGFAILCSTRFDVGGVGLLEETDLFGYDPGSDRYHWYAVTSLGDAHDHVAAPPKPGESINFVYTGQHEGKPLRETIKWTFNDTCTKIDFVTDRTVGGQLAAKIVASMNKK